ncbi:MAG: hypothetical protein U0S36_13785 [Candidatus Nanopelagicales bacterium]
MGRTSYVFAHEVRSPSSASCTPRAGRCSSRSTCESLAPTPVDDTLRSYLEQFADDGAPPVTG